MNMRLLYICLVFSGLFAYLQYTQAFCFYYMEQLQLFLFTRQYAVDTLSQIGGCMTYLSRLIIQFFIYPGVGAFVTALLLTTCIFLMQQILKRLMPATSFLLSALPAIALLYLLPDRNYMHQGTWGFVFMLAMLWGYTCIPRRKFRFFAGIAMQLFVYVVAGPVAFLFACLVLVYELFMDPRHGYYFVLLPVSMLGMGYMSVYGCYTGELRFALLPDAYYDPLVHSGTVKYAWYAALFSLIISGVLRRRKEPEGRKAYIGFAFCLLVVGGLIVLFSFPDRNKVDFEQDHYLRNECWDKIIASFQRENATIQSLNILNLALAKQGQLGDRLLDYPQNGSGSLLNSWDHSVGNAIALSDIYYHIGDIASSQKLAFEGYLSSLQNGNPRLLQRLVKTNLIFGAYPVAEKYLNLLEHTYYYKDWAKKYKNYLNDSAVEQDPELGNKRKALSKGGVYAVSAHLTNVLEQLAINNPDQTIAIQYLAGLYLVNRNLKAFRSLLEKYYHTEIWPSLSIVHQQAVVALWQNTPSEWVKRGVSLKVERQFNLFDDDMRRYHHQPRFREIMYRDHGHTYWYYLMFRSNSLEMTVNNNSNKKKIR